MSQLFAQQSSVDEVVLITAKSGTKQRSKLFISTPKCTQSRINRGRTCFALSN